MAALPQISAGQALVYVVGLEPFLTGRKRRITDRDIAEAVRIPSAIRSDVAGFFADTSWRKDDRPDFDFDAAKQVLEDYDPLQPYPVDGITDDTVLMSLQDAITSAHSLLSQAVPRRGIETMTGVQERPPSDGEIADFRRVWRIATQPRDLWSLYRAGLLGSDHVQMFATVYPTIYQEIGIAMGSYLTTRPDGWSVPWARERRAGILMQVVSVSPDALAQYQSGFAREEGGSGGGGGGRVNVDLENLMTPSQRAEAR